MCIFATERGSGSKRVIHIRTHSPGSYFNSVEPGAAAAEAVDNDDAKRLSAQRSANMFAFQV